MKKIKSYDYKKLLSEELKDNSFKREYDFLENEFKLAKEIIALRQSHNLTQKQLAERVGTSQPAIARLESGNYRNLSLSFLRRVAKALDVEPEIRFKKAKR